MLVLDASPGISARRVENDSLPPSVEILLDRIDNELGSGRRPAIGTVLVSRDDYLVLGTPPERTMVAFRRRIRRLSPKRWTSSTKRTFLSSIQAVNFSSDHVSYGHRVQHGQAHPRQ